MIISNQRQFIFYHLRKCGGTSIERSYEQFSCWDDLIIGSTEHGEKIQNFYLSRFGLHKHSTPNDLRNLNLPHPYPDYTSVALVRNPFDMYESLFRWAIKSVRHVRKFQYEATLRKIRDGKISKPFARWPAIRALAWANGDFQLFLDHLIQTHPKSFRSFSEQLELGDSNPGVKLVFKLEEIEPLWDLLDSVVGSKLQRSHMNRTDKLEVSWSSNHVRYICDRFSKDMKKFGYAKPP